MTNAYLSRLFGLDNQTAVVVGGTGVLGGALCEAIAQARAFVIVAGQNETAGQERVAAIEALGGQAAFVQVNASSRESIAELLEKSLQLRPRIDLLVNCAGVNSATPFEQIKDEDWDRIFRINVSATQIASQIFSAHMRTDGKGGAILNIGSVSAAIPLSRVFAYSASKAAVVNLTQNLARELAPYNIRVNVLCPGFFPAEQNRSILDKQRVDNIMRGTPLNRFGDPEELAGAAILLLANQAGSFITGATYYVDGGFTAMRF